MPTGQQVKAFIRLSRFHFLPMPILGYALGALAAQRETGPIDTRLLVMGLLIELLAQLSVSYFNDYWDLPSDRINQRRTLLSGGSGELATGVLRPSTALYAGAVCQGGAILLALWTGLPAISWLFLALALGAALFYTAPPLKLSWRGWGELTTALVAGLFVPLWAYSLQTGTVSTDLILLVLPLIPFVMSMFIAIAAPDTEADRRVGKRTLAVRVGERRIALAYAVVIVLGYGTALVCWWSTLPPLVLLALLPLVVAAWHGLRAPLSTRTWPLTWMILRAALVPALLLLALNIAVHFT